MNEVVINSHADADLAVLRANSVLSKLGVGDVEVLAGYLDEVAIAHDTVVLREGDLAEHMYFVLSGHITLDRGGVELHPLGPGGHFGELGLIGGNARAATAVTTTTVRLARLSRFGYGRMVGDHPALGVRFLEALVCSLGDTLAAMTDNVGQLMKLRSAPRLTEVEVHRGTEVFTVRTGTPLRTLLPSHVNGAAVIAGMIDAKPVSLETPLLSDASIEPLTLASAEGRVVYRRGAGLLLLEAARMVAPDVTLRMGPSIGPAQVVVVDPIERARDLERELEHAFRNLVEKDVPFREELWTVDEARVELRKAGFHDAASLLRVRRTATVTLQSAGEVYALENGPLPSSSATLKNVTLKPHVEGFLLDFGEPIATFMPPAKPGAPGAVELESVVPRFGGEMADAHRRWLQTLGITSVGDFNDRCISGQVSQVIRVGEGFHEKRIGHIADVIAKARDRVRIVAVAGPSSSGKTTFIKRLKVQLEVNGVRPIGLSLDDYYRDRDDTPLDESGQRDYEAFEALQIDLLHEHLADLLAGKTVATAHFDFLSGKGHQNGGPHLTLGAGEVLLLEGIHGLNPALLGDKIAREQAFRIFVHPATTLPFDRLTPVSSADVRLLRRIVRDRHGRGAKAADNILRWPSVRRGERVHIYPCLPNADAVFDTSLVYELSVLKVFADRYLLEVPERHPAFSTAFRLRQVLDRFVTIYPDHVPPTSLLREFIGGSGFEY
ncbi:MAG: cyclic nucleotide-binding domain-containing protein [Polyangiaceae bacterium]|nr:cyclic nucleotide-binding domain-containing protein [Polyangiaceae bacterium]